MMTSKERLEFLAGALERNAANPKGMKFTLRAWLFTEYRGTTEDKPALDCGTAGCAVGLATLLPELQNEGLSMTKGIGDRWVPVYKGYEGFQAVALFFGITRPSSEHLFHGQNYDLDQQRGAEGELAVAKRIRLFLANPRWA